MTSILTINNLSKRYGRIQALKTWCSKFIAGKCSASGPNGSGKTTTLSILLDLIRSDEGSFSWFGEKPTVRPAKRIGSVIESPNFFPYLTPVINLQIVADIKNLDYDDIDRVLQLTGLYERRNSRFKTFSFGMKQRLAVASALLGNPDVLILDEPTNGLDPQGIAHIRSLILQVAAEGTTIIMASHLLDEVQKICTHVAVLQKGVKLFDGKVSEVLAVSDSFEMRANNLEGLVNWLTHNPDVESVTKKEDLLQVYFKKHVNPEEINQECFRNGIILTHLAERRRSLEQHFLELLEENE